MMAVVDQQAPPPINAVFGDGEEEVLRVHMLVNHVHSPLLVCQAFPVTALNEARVLRDGS